MELGSIQSHSLHSLSCMNPLSLSSKLKPQTLLRRINFRFFCTPVSVQLSETEELVEAPSGRRSRSKAVSKARVKVSDVQVKHNWLSSLSSPPLVKLEVLGGDGGLLLGDNGSDCVIGIYPDVSGAIAFFRTDHLGCSAQDEEVYFISLLSQLLETKMTEVLRFQHGQIYSVSVLMVRDFGTIAKSRGKAAMMVPKYSRSKESVTITQGSHLF